MRSEAMARRPTALPSCSPPLAGQEPRGSKGRARPWLPGQLRGGEGRGGACRIPATPERGRGGRGGGAGREVDPGLGGMGLGGSAGKPASGWRQSLCVPSGRPVCAALHGVRLPSSRPTPHLGGAAAALGTEQRFCCSRSTASGRRSSDSHFLSPPASGSRSWGGCSRWFCRSLRPPRKASRSRSRAVPWLRRRHGRRPGRRLGGGGPAPRGRCLLLHLQADAGPAARRPRAPAAPLEVRR